MLSRAVSPYRENWAPATVVRWFQRHPVWVAVISVLFIAVLVTAGAFYLPAHFLVYRDVRQERNNAAAEAISATKRLYGVPPDAIYCRPEVAGTICAHMYPQGSNLCDVFVPNTGSIQLCCDTHDYRNNTGCSVRVLTLGDLQWRQDTQ